MAIPTLTLTDADSNVYTFPEDFWLKSEPVNTSSKIVNRTYASGGKNVADGFLEAKTVIISGALRDNTLAGLETKRRAFMKACLKGGQLKVSDDTVARYIQIEAPKFQIKTGYRTEVIVTVNFIAEDPFWRDSSETTDSQTVAGDDTLTVDNSGSDFIIFPIIEIENDQGVDNPGVKMINTSDGSMTFEYNDASFLDGDLLVINCEEGTVFKNNNNAIANFDPARFFRLQALSNTIEYEGAACTIRFRFRKAYL